MEMQEPTGCSDPSTARALLRGLRVSIDGRYCWSTILEHSLIVSSTIREGSTYGRPWPSICRKPPLSTYEDSKKAMF